MSAPAASPTPLALPPDTPPPAAQHPFSQGVSPRFTPLQIHVGTALAAAPERASDEQRGRDSRRRRCKSCAQAALVALRRERPSPVETGSDAGSGPADPRDAPGGHASCFIETGYGQAMLMDFDHDTEPLPGRFPLPGVGPFTLLGESSVNHRGKLAFKWLCWNVLLEGKELPMDHRMATAGKWS